MARDTNDQERTESVLYAMGVRESGEVAKAIADALKTENPVSKLSQTTDQVRAERDLLLLSQSALLAQVAKLKRVSASRLARLKGAKHASERP